MSDHLSLLKGAATMRLYYHPYSDNSRRTLMTALHLGAPVTLAPVDLQKGEQHQPNFLKLNPNHRVPVLEDDGFVLWEPCAIMQYLADKTPNQTLYPLEIRARADVNRWLFWCGQHLTPAVGILNREYVIKAMLGLGGPDAAEVRRGEDWVCEFGAVLDAHLANREWVCGSVLTLADFAIVTPLTGLLAVAAPERLPIASFAHLRRWLARGQALEAWKRTAFTLGQSADA